MEIYKKYVAVCEKKNPTIIERITRKTRDRIAIWAPCIINGFDDKIDYTRYKSVEINPTEEFMEFYGKSMRAFLESEIQVVTLK